MLFTMYAYLPVLVAPFLVCVWLVDWFIKGWLGLFGCMFHKTLQLCFNLPYLVTKVIILVKKTSSNYCLKSFNSIFARISSSVKFHLKK
jgi:hypothetical protein